MGQRAQSPPDAREGDMRPALQGVVGMRTRACLADGRLSSDRAKKAWLHHICAGGISKKRMARYQGALER